MGETTIFVRHFFLIHRQYLKLSTAFGMNLLFPIFDPKNILLLFKALQKLRLPISQIWVISDLENAHSVVQINGWNFGMIKRKGDSLFLYVLLSLKANTKSGPLTFHFSSHLLVVDFLPIKVRKFKQLQEASLLILASAKGYFPFMLQDQGKRKRKERPFALNLCNIFPYLSLERLAN